MESEGASSTSSDMAVASTSTKSRRSGLFRSLCGRFFEPNNAPEYNLFSCFQFFGSHNNNDRSKATLSSNDNKELQEEVTLQKQEGGVQICDKCKKLFLSDDGIGEDELICPTCYKKEEEDMFNCTNETSVDVGASGEDTEMKTFRDNDVFKQPMQCTSCKKIFRTTLKEYMTDEEIFRYNCLDCHIKEVLLSKEPESAVHLANSIVEKEIADIKKKMWDSMCSVHSRSPTCYHKWNKRCDASVCTGYSWHWVDCNDCKKSFHTRCVSLPDYCFHFFTCKECIREKKGPSASSSSLERRFYLRKPEAGTSKKYHEPEPGFCCVCKSRVYYCDIRNKPWPHQIRCLNCMHGSEFMV